MAKADHTYSEAFDGRASFLANADNGNSGGNGHGTHVAGTIGSKTYDVAKKIKLFAVKVLDDNEEGTTSGVIAGINFAASDFKTRSGCSKDFVANMSLGGGKSSSLNTAAANLVSSGVFFAIAAGNEATNTNTKSHASEVSVCTVGANTSSDGFAYYSHYSSVVDVLAPGSSITRTYNNGGTTSLSGTSMASTHVAGLAAYYMGLGGSSIGLCS